MVKICKSILCLIILSILLIDMISASENKRQLNENQKQQEDSDGGELQNEQADEKNGQREFRSRPWRRATVAPRRSTIYPGGPW